MGKWKTLADGEKIPTDDATTNEDMNHWFDYRDKADTTHTSGWGAAEAGRWWWNTTLGCYQYWDGSAVQTVPGAAGGAAVTLPFVVVDADDGSDLIDKVSTYEDTMPIWVPPGTYDVTTSSIDINVASGTHPTIIGAGSEVTIITGTGAKIFDVQQTAYPSATVPLTIRGFKIQHEQSNATDITMDLMNSQPMLSDITLVESSVAHYHGTAIKVGSGSSQSPTGKGVSWYDVTATYYNIGFHLGLDHGSFHNCVVNYPKDKGFYIADTFDSATYYADWMTFYGCHTMSSAATRGTCYPWYFDKIGYGVAGVYGAHHEDSTALTNNMFTVDAANRTNYIVMVFGFGCHGNQKALIANDFDRVRVFGCNVAEADQSGMDYGDYEDIAGPAWSSPSGATWEGRKVTMFNSGAAEYRAYSYINGGWHYVALT